MRIYLAVVFFACLISCSNDSKKNQVNLPKPEKGELPVSNVELSEFTSFLNEFIPKITKIKHDYLHEIDTLGLDSTKRYKYLELETKSVYLAFNHHFKCGNHFKNLSVVELVYTDSYSAKTGMKMITEQLIQNGEYMSKTPEYIQQKGTRIYWLRASCTFPDINFKKVCNGFNAVIKSSPNSTNILIGCGGSSINPKVLLKVNSD